MAKLRLILTAAQVTWSYTYQFSLAETQEGKSFFLMIVHKALRLPTKTLHLGVKNAIHFIEQIQTIQRPKGI